MQARLRARENRTQGEMQRLVSEASADEQLLTTALSSDLERQKKTATLRIQERLRAEVVAKQKTRARRMSQMSDHERLAARLHEDWRT